MQNCAVYAKIFTCPNVEQRKAGISATVMAKAWAMDIPSARWTDISESELPVRGRGLLSSELYSASQALQ